MMCDRKEFFRGSRSALLAFLMAVLPLSVAFAAPKVKSAKPAQLKSSDCLACHADASMTKEVDGKTISLQVKEDKFKNSIHGQMFQCTDCHKDITALPHDKVAKVDCAQCHTDEQKQYDGSLHAKAIAGGDARAARCLDCHGNIHEVVPTSDPTSPVAHHNIPKTCGSCHGQKFVMQQAGMNTAPLMAYQQSVHGKLVEGGDLKAAVCSDCHSPHNIKRANDTQSSIAKANVAATCAKCHDAQKTEFMQSIHGKALLAGNLNAPTCTDCHGIHTIKRPGDPNSSVSAENLAKNTCARCHESVRLSDEFGVPGRRATTYLASYHGLALEMGSKKAANCASCHGVHNILPSSDLKSTINAKNLIHTCGQCHPGANENFAKAKVHVDAAFANDIGSRASLLVRNFYLLMILGTIGGMLAHNLIILRKKLILRRDGHAHMSGGERTVVRMSQLQRYQHFGLLSSFIVLVLTGFALKYPESIVGLVFVNETIRSYTHRVAGTVLILVSLYHVYYAMIYREGRNLIKDMFPSLKDATDVRDVLLYYTGLSATKPEFERFSYAEKMEYWALVWGTFVMAVTGLMAWFKVPVGNLLPRWTIDVGMTVHFYEAILATLAILVWHFYMIIFDPDVYPMNWAWYDGKMSLEHYREEHRLDVQTIEGTGHASPSPKAAEHGTWQ